MNLQSMDVFVTYLTGKRPDRKAARTCIYVLILADANLLCFQKLHRQLRSEKKRLLHVHRLYTTI